MRPKGRTGFGWQRWWLWGLLILLGVGSWGIWGRRTPPPPPSKPAPAETPSHMEGLSLTEIQDGDKRWVLEAHKANFQKERLEIVISGVRVEFFGPDEHLFIKADEGQLNTKTRVLTLRGQVELTFGDLTAKTGTAIYQPTERVVLAPEDLTLETPRIKVQGKGLKVEMANKKLTLAQHRLTEVKAFEWGHSP